MLDLLGPSSEQDAEIHRRVGAHFGPGDGRIETAAPAPSSDPAALDEHSARLRRELLVGADHHSLPRDNRHARSDLTSYAERAAVRGGELDSSADVIERSAGLLLNRNGSATNGAETRGVGEAAMTTPLHTHA